MLLIGKMKPESISVGRNDVRSAIWNATCCDSAIVEISTPNASAPTRKSDTQAMSAVHEPRTGRSNSTIDTATTPSDEASEITKYGTVFPITYAGAPMGDI